MTTDAQTRSHPLPPPPADRRPRAGAAAVALFVAVLCAGAVAAIDRVMVHTVSGQRLDQFVLDRLDDSAEGRSTLSTLLQEVTVGSIALILGGCVIVALMRRRWTLAAAAVLVVVGANVTTQVLKADLLTRPSWGFGYAANSLPSGHMTVVASLVLAALLVVPAGGRWLVSLAGSLGIAVTGVGTIVASWHRPSDVLAALAVSLAWGALALAALSLIGTDRPVVAPRARLTAILVGALVAGALFAAIGVPRPGVDLAVAVLTTGVIAGAGALVVGCFARMVDARIS